VSKKITIYPVTRIEGHAKVTVIIDGGEVQDARFQVLEFRAFEHFLKGRPVEEAPIIVTRICGLCSVSHHLASVKAVDKIFDLEIPPQAEKLRIILHLAGLIHSHVLHFFLLYLPDLALTSLPPNKRGFTELVKHYPDLIKLVINIRGFARRILETLGGSSIHPSAAIPGGFAKPLSSEDRIKLLDKCKEATKLFSKVLSLIDNFIDKSLSQDVGIKSNFVSMYHQNDLALYDSPKIRAISSNGDLIDEFSASEYLDHINEYVVPWSYAKAPFLIKLGYPNGLYRVGPLARLNIVNKIDSDWAEELREKYGLKSSKPRNSTRYYNVARLVELAYCFDKICRLLEDKELEKTLRREKKIKVEHNDGVGVVEAPRGTLIHHYFVNDEGLVVKANMIVATVQNTPIISEDIKSIVTKFIKANSLDEGKLISEISTLIRDYDPCLSCSVHSLSIPLVIEFISTDGSLIARIPNESNK